MTHAILETPTSRPRLDYPTVVPKAIQAMLALSGVAKRGGLDATLLYLVDIRASQLNGCAFCLDMHIREAQAAGVGEDRVNLVAAWRDVDIYSERERAALQWTELLTQLAGRHVTDDDFAAARAVFSETELTYLSLAVVAINGWNRLNVGFRMPPRFGS